MWEQLLLIFLPSGVPYKPIIHIHAQGNNCSIGKNQCFSCPLLPFPTRPSPSTSFLGDVGIKTGWGEGQIDFSTQMENKLLEWSQRRREIHMRRNLFSFSVLHGETTFSASSVQACVYLEINSVPRGHLPSRASVLGSRGSKTQYLRTGRTCNDHSPFNENKCFILRLNGMKEFLLRNLA